MALLGQSDWPNGVGFLTQVVARENRIDGEKGKPIERWGRKATGLRSAYVDYDGWVAAEEAMYGSSEVLIRRAFCFTVVIKAQTF